MRTRIGSSFLILLEGPVTVANSRDWKQSRTSSSHLLISPDGRMLASSSDTLRLWISNRLGTFSLVFRGKRVGFFL